MTLTAHLPGEVVAAREAGAAAGRAGPRRGRRVDQGWLIRACSLNKSTMRAWVGREKIRAVEVTSPLPPDECVRRLARVTTTRRERWYLDPRTATLPDPVFHGTVEPSRVRIGLFPDMLGRIGHEDPVWFDVRVDPGPDGGTILAGTAGSRTAPARAVFSLVLIAVFAALAVFFFCPRGGHHCLRALQPGGWGSHRGPSHRSFLHPGGPWRYHLGRRRPGPAPAAEGVRRTRRGIHVFGLASRGRNAALLRTGRAARDDDSHGAFSRGAGDSNRTHTVSLGICRTRRRTGADLRFGPSANYRFRTGRG